MMRLVFQCFIVLTWWGVAAPAAARPFACTEQAALWKFHTALPVSGPAVALPPSPGHAYGTVFLASHEGYVHALRADGRFEWSYTVEGGIVHPLGYDSAHNQVLLSTTAGFIYSFRADGGLNWRLKSPYHSDSALAPSPRGSVYFTHGSRIFAASKGGGLLWSAPLDAAPVAGPYVDSRGFAWVLTETGQLHSVLRPSKRDTIETGRAGDGRIALLGDRIIVSQGGVLSALAENGRELWRREGEAWAAVAQAAPGGVAIADAEGVAWLDGDSGELQARVGFEPLVSAPPLVSEEYVLVPDARGFLWLAEQGQSVQRCVLAAAPLLTPTLEPTRGQLIVAAGDGKVAAFAWPPEGER